MASRRRLAADLADLVGPPGAKRPEENGRGCKPGSRSAVGAAEEDESTLAMDAVRADDDDADRRVLTPRSSPHGHPDRRSTDGHRPAGKGFEAVRVNLGLGSVSVLNVVRVVRFVRRVRVGSRARRVRAERLG